MSDRANKIKQMRRTLGLCFGVLFVMGGLVAASVPLYDLFCRVTGYGGTTQRAEIAPMVKGERVIRIEFDAGVSRAMPWRFVAPPDINVKIGETGLAFYTAHNPTDRAVTGTASFNVVPQKAGAYFSKIECFCFTEQVLQSGQTVEMPVTFFIDPEIINDAEMNDVKTITLSYTFFKTKQVADKSPAAPKG